MLIAVASCGVADETELELEKGFLSFCGYGKHPGQHNSRLSWHV